MEQRKAKRSKAQNQEWISGILFLLPNLIGFLAFLAVPVVMGLVISFSDYDNFSQFNFVGISNYVKMFKDQYFQTALLNNLFYTLVSVPLTLLGALLIALALNTGIKGNGLFKTAFYFPSITSMVAIGIIWALIFNPTKGPINQFLVGLGVSEPPQWLASTDTALMTVIIVVVWKSAGYYMIMFMGGLKNIPAQLYEAAEIDGAGTWRKFLNVTWPMLSPTTFMVSILCIINSFQVFDIINIMTRGGPGRSTNVLVVRIYQEGFQNGKMGYASAMAYFLFLIILVITLVQFRGQKKWVNY